ncbi:Diacylglycerol kinase family enzyme [Rubritalea squalenifaciens DSM 18772]|uniref:Diacylglycerol kinase family enzyme n=1 Tax=Rubritalea squalenifaciens DSM 18772 TaxID=1123071 RepID=A0A1M6LT37_9BACT|nr:diacylglycerol kinase family protein [Rubritalea squalenifaciens]SHJ74246.1 Diacylglycerol kinase family enzyme [Rubritalea squalenifaciens DSM 18772]
MRAVTVLINQQSGTARSIDLADFCDTIREILGSYLITPSIQLVDGAQVEDSIRQAITEKPESLIVGGGDGTIATAAGLLESTNISLGILPMGTFNLAARDHEIPLDLEEALHVLAKASPVTTSLLRVSGQPCLCTCIIGFYPRMTRILDEYHGTQWWRKTWNIFKVSVVRFTKSPLYEFTYETDTSSLEYRSRMLAIVPGAYRDSLGIIPERTSTTPLSLTLYIFKHRTRIAMLRGIFAFLAGKLANDDDMQVLSATKASLDFGRKKEIKTLIDGEVLQLPNPIKLSLEPESLRILHPQL